MRKKDKRKIMGKLGMNRHHWINKSKGGQTNKRNVSWLKINKHRAWHILFGNLSLREVIELLTRLERIKNGSSGYL